MPTEHAFAPFLRTIGKGPNVGRPLEFAEARDAMRMILEAKVEPAQIGAFLLLLRYRGESGDEIAGLVAGARDHLDRQTSSLDADIDWPSYAEPHNQMPWFLLSALLLAENGVRVLMHGSEGSAGTYPTTRAALAELGIAPAVGVADACRQLEHANFTYIGLETLTPELNRLFDFRHILGVRTVANTLARALNPGRAPAQIVGVAHPPYMATHQAAALRLEQSALAVVKGGGGEAQRNPLKPCRAAIVSNGRTGEWDFPALLPGIDHDWRREQSEPARLAALWRDGTGEAAHIAAIVATTAVTLRLLGRADNARDADAMAAGMWENRNRLDAGGGLKLSA